MTVVHSFDPLGDERATTLILGSMPGVVSLTVQQYYAHPQNSFWKIMGELFTAGLDVPYPERVQRLCDHGIAVWDVLELCTREGSLDSAIVESSIVPNDFAEFFRTHPHVDRVFFNGAKAEASYRRYVAPADGVTYTRLPSTSPANASMRFEDKLTAWRVVTPG